MEMKSEDWTEKVEERYEALKRMPQKTQEQRVAVLKEAADILKDVDFSSPSEMDEDEFWLVDDIHNVTDATINDLLENLSKKTCLHTHEEVQRDFQHYEIPGLDSIQYIENSTDPRYEGIMNFLKGYEHGPGANDMIQLTLSDNNFFNADTIRIPVTCLGGDRSDRFQAIAKYNQTQEEFEKETGLKYDETYVHTSDGEYASRGIEPFGNIIDDLHDGRCYSEYMETRLAKYFAETIDSSEPEVKRDIESILNCADKGSNHFDRITDKLEGMGYNIDREEVEESQEEKSEPEYEKTEHGGYDDYDVEL